MPCRVVFEGELAKLRVTLVEPQEGLPGTGDVPVRGDFRELLAPRGSELDPEELRSSLKDELTKMEKRAAEAMAG